MATIRTVHVTMNTKAFVRRMQRNNDYMINQTKKIVNTFATSMVMLAQRHIRSDTGRLVRSIRKYKVGNDGLSMDVRTSVPYANYVEYGTGIHNINGNGRRTPWFYLDKRRDIVVRTRGQKPRLFFRKAFDQTISNAEMLLQGVFKWQ